jgi:response regulator RpfG family c-di-GMP phosphodiesterase
MQNIHRLWERFTEFAQVETDDPALKRKGQLLSLFIGLCGALVFYMLINNIVLQFIRPSSENMIYIFQDVLSFIPFYTFWYINKKGRVMAAAYISVTFTILATILLSDVKFIEYLMVVFALPIGMSSFIIRPSSSFIFASLTSFVYTIASIFANYAWEYNLTAILSLFALAFMTWVTAHLLENAIQKNNDLVLDLQNTNQNIRQAYESTLEGWSRALEIRDRETEGHTQRVTQMTMRMARLMNFTEEQLCHIRRGALLHDIGKLGIPDEILHKPGPLTEQELNIMRTHTQIAQNLLSPIEYLRPALNIPSYHHETWDGTGYPHKLKGEDIPLEARIFAIIDVYDAISHDRPYRKAWPKQKAIEYILAESGKHFDPNVVEIFIKEIQNED